MKISTDSKVGGEWQQFHMINGKREATRAWLLHLSIAHRAGSKADYLRCYSDCQISEEFQDFQFFADWCNRQIGYSNIDVNGKFWAIDKDLTVKGNRIYGPETCAFVPIAINSLIQRSSARKSGLPIGVRKSGGRFTAHTKDRDKKETYIGAFSDMYLAFAAYKERKEAEIKRVALLWRDEINQRLFDSLMNWKVEWKD
jgi:hypothetical protein